MKTSISRRLFSTIFIIVLGISALILLANSLLLKPLYYGSIKSAMLHGVDTLSEVDYSAEWNLIVDEIKEQTAGSSYDIIVRNNERVLYSDSKEFGLMPRSEENAAGSFESGSGDAAVATEPDGIGGQRYIKNFPDFNVVTDPLLNQEGWEQIDGNTSIGIVTEPRMGIEMYICTHGTENGVKIILTQAIEPINQSIRQANILLIACAAITLGLSVIVVFKLSRRFTEPIRQIKGKVGEIAALQFGEPCSIKTGDELQSLGSDVNLLGEKLKNVLDTLRL